MEKQEAKEIISDVLCELHEVDNLRMVGNGLTIDEWMESLLQTVYSEFFCKTSHSDEQTGSVL